MNKINVAIFPCEAENAYELSRSLRYAPRFNIIGFTGKTEHCIHEFPHIVGGLPYIQEANFLSVFSEALRCENISYIFPTHDTVAEYLKKNEDKLPAKVLCSPAPAAEICRDKKKTYDVLKNETFCPKIYTADSVCFPVFAKPRTGQGGKNCFCFFSKEEFDISCFSAENMIFCEYLPGMEITADCFTDRHGNLLYVGPRSREVIKQGIAYRSSSLPLSEEIFNIASRISQKLGMRGLWFFQLKQDKNNNWKLLEVSARAATTMNLTRHRGVNLPLLALFDALGYDLSVIENDFSICASRCLQTKYEISTKYQTVYLDLDDTLIIDGTVNKKIIAFVYQCQNKNKDVVLLSRHDGDILEYLDKFHISSALFKKIIRIDDNQKKSDFFEENNAILIDNLFTERQEAFSKGLSVFDVDAVDALLTEF